MFFDLVLLRRQHEGRFNFAWLAGTRGIQYVSKKDVLELDISRLSDEISEYVCSSSDSPRSRFSLRLSAVLINGTLKIHRQQAVYLYEELAKCLTVISKPLTIFIPSPSVEFGERGFIATPPTPVLKKKGKKKVPSIPKSSPESQLERLIADIRALEVGRALTYPEESASVLQARADEVTLRETHPLREVHADDFGDLGGPLPSEEELRRDIAGLEIEEIELPGPEIVALRPSESPLKTRRRVVTVSSSSESEPDVGPVVITTEVQVHATSGFEQPPKLPEKESITTEPRSREIQPVEIEEPQEIEAVQIQEPREVIAEVERIRARRALAETTLAAIEERDKEIRKARDKKKDKDYARLFISTKPTKIVRINRCEPGGVEWVDIHPYPLPEFQLKTPDLTNLLNMYVVREEKDLQKRKKVSEVSSLEESLTLQRKEGRVTPPAKISVETRPIPTVMVEQVTEETPVPQIQVTAEAVELPVEIMPSLETQILVEHPLLEELQVTRPPAITSTPIKRKTPETEARTIEEVRAVAAEEEAVSRRKRRRLLDVEPEPLRDLDFITLPSELGSRDLTSLAPEPVSLTEGTLESVPLPVIAEQARQQEIVEKIFASGRLTLEELCQRPVNRLNIARAFNDLLILSKYNYVTLVNKENSSELEYIERGSKLIQK